MGRHQQQFQLRHRHLRDQLGRYSSCQGNEGARMPRAAKALPQRYPIRKIYKTDLK